MQVVSEYCTTRRGLLLPQRFSPYKYVITIIIIIVQHPKDIALECCPPKNVKVLAELESQSSIFPYVQASPKQQAMPNSDNNTILNSENN